MASRPAQARRAPTGVLEHVWRLVIRRRLTQRRLRVLARAEKLLRAALTELASLHSSKLDAGGRARLQAAAGSARDQLNRILLSTRV